MPDFTASVNTNGQLTTSVNFRKGGQADAYVALRQWCWRHDVNFSDIVNSLIGPLAHFCQNFGRLDAQGNVIVTLNFGDIRLEKVYGNGPKRKVKYRDMTPAEKAVRRASRKAATKLW